jgi:hypothetical protein
MVKIMRNANASERRVIDVIRLKQGGVCRFCKETISRDDEVVSSGKNKKYYHKHCAKKLNII